MKLIDRTNQRYGKLICLEYAGESKWLCRCDCGVEKIIDSRRFSYDHDIDCGNHYYEHHNMRHTTEYNSWTNILSRCCNPNNRDYPNYGGRGIGVCDRWRHSFSAFYEDMGPKPEGDYSVDRVDNEGQYEPSNCKWSTRTEQASNKRNNRMITFRDRTMTLAQWAREANVIPQTLASAINNHGVEVGIAMYLQSI